MEEYKTSVSIIIPFKDEEESIAILSDEISNVMDTLSLPWECIWIDDGSIDRSAAYVRKLQRNRSNYHLIRFDQNYGQSAALWCGFKHAHYNTIVTLDCDLQNNPADIPLLLELLSKSGADMVNGIRTKRSDSIIKLISSRIGNGFRNFFTKSSISDVGCALRAFQKHCVLNIPLFKGMHRFLPTLIEMQGFRIIETPVHHRARIKGKSKYGINNRLWVGIIDTLAVRWMQLRFVYPKVKL